MTNIFSRNALNLLLPVIIVLTLFSSACAQRLAGDKQGQQNKNLSVLPSTAAKEFDDESLIKQIRDVIVKKDYNSLAELLKSKPNLNVRNKTNDSLLIETMFYDLKSFEMLLDAGADPNFASEVNGCGETEHCLKPPAYIAFNAENLPALKLLLKVGADPNAESILAWAVSRDNQAAVELMIAYKADVNFNNSTGKAGQTPLFFAAEPKTAEILIKNGADVNHADQQGETPLMIAVDEDNLEMVKFFVKSGANVDTKNKQGETALQMSMAKGTKKITIELKKFGATM